MGEEKTRCRGLRPSPLSQSRPRRHRAAHHTHGEAMAPRRALHVRRPRGPLQPFCPSGLRYCSPTTRVGCGRSALRLRLRCCCWPGPGAAESWWRYGNRCRRVCINARPVLVGRVDRHSCRALPELPSNATQNVEIGATARRVQCCRPSSLPLSPSTSCKHTTLVGSRARCLA